MHLLVIVKPNTEDAWKYMGTLVAMIANTLFITTCLIHQGRGMFLQLIFASVHRSANMWTPARSLTQFALDSSLKPYGRCLGIITASFDVLR